MKTLELSNYGVQEMNAGEMEQVNGGIAPWLIIVAVLAVAAAIDYFQDGKLDGKISIN